MIKIADAANTENHAIHLLIKQGYSISMCDEGEVLTATALDTKHHASATDALSLLALVHVKDGAVEEYHQSDYTTDAVLLAIHHLLEQGFKINISDAHSGEWFDYEAKKIGFHLIARTPLRLLGLFLIHELWESHETVPYYLDLLLS